MRFLKRHPWALLAAAYSMLMVVVQTTRAVERFRRPFALWMTDAPRWYDEALGAVMCAVVGAASIVYLCRKWREEGRIDAAGTIAAPPPRWRHKKELRFVLYCLAALLAVQFPLGVVQTIRALQDDPPPFQNNFISLFPVGGWLCPLIGTAIVVYDRRRIRREGREDSGACLHCGYDLRASKERCPECGTPIPILNP
jgi:hypothetical protein